jgi:DNA-binding transcriptional LysR family regulator
VTVPVLPSIKGLHALSMLERHGGLEAAAAQLGVSRSALSHRLADLEAQLGVRLVRKSGRRIVLTDEGEALLAAMGDALERILAAVQPLRRRRTQVRLSCGSTFASHWLLPRLPDFQRRHPDVEIAVSTTTRTVDFASEDFDCAIRQGLGAWRGLRSTLLFHESLAPVAAPALADRLGAGGVRSKAAVLIHARSRVLDWPVWWRHAGQPGAPPEGGIIVDTRGQALDAALAGVGVAVTDLVYIERRLREGALRLVSDRSVQLSEGSYLVHDERAGRGRAVSAIRTWLVETARPAEAVRGPGLPSPPSWTSPNAPGQ